MEKITLGEENIESIGLVFEPNFFRVYFYSDETGENFVKTKAYPRNVEYDFSALRSKNHLFALSTLPQWTIVPAAIFREKDAAKYLQLNTDFSRDDEIAFSSLDGLEAVIIHRKDKESDQLMNQIQPAMEGKHLTSVLLESTRRKVSRGKNSLMQIVVLDGMAIIVIFNNGSLLLANSLTANKAEDLLYYIFYSLKKLGVSTEIETEILGYGGLLSSVKKQGMKFLKNFKSTTPDSDERNLAKILSQCA